MESKGLRVIVWMRMVPVVTNGNSLTFGLHTCYLQDYFVPRSTWLQILSERYYNTFFSEETETSGGNGATWRNIPLSSLVVECLKPAPPKWNICVCEKQVACAFREVWKGMMFDLRQSHEKCSGPWKDEMPPSICMSQ